MDKILYLKFLKETEEVIFDELLDSVYMSVKSDTLENMHKNILKEINYVKTNYTVL